MSVHLDDIEYQIRPHALMRMKERGITEADIQSCLDDYQVSLRPKEGYSLYIADHPNGRRLQVILDTSAKEIVSVVWLD